MQFNRALTYSCLCYCDVDFDQIDRHDPPADQPVAMDEDEIGVVPNEESDVPQEVAVNPNPSDGSGSSDDSHVAYFLGDDVASVLDDDHQNAKRKGDDNSVSNSLTQIIKRPRSQDEDEN